MITLVITLVAMICEDHTAMRPVKDGKAQSVVLEWNAGTIFGIHSVSEDSQQAEDGTLQVHSRFGQQEA